MSTPPKRILVRGVNWLGDAVMSTPALARLRQAYPEAEITLLTRKSLADLWRHHAGLDHCLAYEPRESPWHIARRLRPLQFDLGLVLPNSPRSALELFLAGIPKRMGYATAWRRWFLTDPVSRPRDWRPMRKRSARAIRRLTGRQSAPAGETSPAGCHQVHHYLRLAAAAGASADPLAPRLMVTAEELEAARRRFLAGKNPAIRWLGLCPGAAYGPAKCWPLDRFVAAAAAVHRQTGHGWLVLGGALEQERMGAMARAMEEAGVGEVVDLTGKTSLRDLCALLGHCEGVLTNDSGPMHVAAAVGTPVVALFGSTAPELTGPGHPNPGRHGAGKLVVLRRETPCAPCFRRQCPIDFRCMRGIEVSQASTALLELLRQKR